MSPPKPVVETREESPPPQNTDNNKIEDSNKQSSPSNETPEDPSGKDEWEDLTTDEDQKAYLLSLAQVRRQLIQDLGSKTYHLMEWMAERIATISSKKTAEAYRSQLRKFITHHHKEMEQIRDQIDQLVENHLTLEEASAKLYEWALKQYPDDE